MTGGMFSRAFKQDAVGLVTGRGVRAAQTRGGVGISATVLRRWMRAAEADGSAALPGNGGRGAEQEDLRPLWREMSRLKAERDIFKKAAASCAKDQL